MKQLLSCLFLMLCVLVNAQINPCAKAKNIHVVILGSSTAAGAGPSSSDSTWVNRYRKYLLSINPSNQVTNLARGGYNTYRIQADNYIAPSGRPSTDSIRNISQALRLNPDAIIVNMPSNDAASGYDVNEQMSNFIRLKLVADSSNVPIWICTTQPRNFSPQATLIQTQTRDSIFSYFGTKAIDFWTGFADTSNGIKAIFDSGDGVHMNDAAHNILNQRVIQKLIPNALADTNAVLDFAALSINAVHFDKCGKLSQQFDMIYTNLGPTSAQNLNIQIQSSSTHPFTTNVTRNPLSSCTEDTLHFYFNTTSPGSYRLQFLVNALDSNPANDSSTYLQFNILGQPQSGNVLDTVCEFDSILLMAQSSLQTDHTLWYSDSNAMNLMHIGDTLSVQSAKDTTYFFRFVRGPLHYVDQLDTDTNSTTNWNGMMFDIIALDSITIDSLAVKFFDTGNQQVQAYYRNGTYKGYEALPNAWTSWGMDSINVTKNGEFLSLDYPDLNLSTGDTLGVYLHLLNASSRLSYRASGSPQSIGNTKISIPSGSGVSHTFGTTYTPRNFVGSVFYHFGQNLNGDCHSRLSKYKVATYSSSFNLGPDTMLYVNQALNIHLPTGFSNVQWSNGDTTHQIQFDQGNLNQGHNLIFVDAYDEHGCLFTDSIRIFLNFSTNTKEIQEEQVLVYPNPTKDLIFIKNLNVSDAAIYHLNGQLIRSIESPNLEQLNLENLSPGAYLIELNSKSGYRYRCIIFKE